MQIKSEAKQVLTWSGFKSTDSSYEFALHCEWIHPGQVHNYNFELDTVKLTLMEGQEKVLWGHSSDFTTGGTFPNTTVVIIKRRDDAGSDYSVKQFIMIDWGKIYNDHISQSEKNEKETNVVSDPVAIASASLTAVSAAMAVVPALAPISGVLNIITSIISATTASGPEDTLDIDEIVSAMKVVVRQELDMQSAERSSTAFVAAANWLRDEEAMKQLGQHLYQDFQHDLESFVAESGPLVTELTHMNQHPEEAKFVLPTYALGVSAYVQMIWYHLIMIHFDGDVLTPDILQVFRTKIARCKDGIDAAIATVAKEVEAKIAELKAGNLDETPSLRKALTKELCGLEDLSKPTDVSGRLNEILEGFDADIVNAKNGTELQHVWKHNWKLPVPA